MKHKRFTWTEISYHWAYAITFLPLLITGAIMIVQKLFAWQIVSKETLVWWHKYIGIGFIVFPFLIALAGDWRIHLTNFIECLTWKKSDLQWMNKMAMQKKDLPKVGKFNPGQKINMLLTIMNYFAFAVTGIIIWFEKGAIGAWYIHIILFAFAIPMLAGHLFLATINPSTRGGLPGIFHGNVPLEYMEHHHALVLEEKRPTIALKGIWRLLLVIPIIIFLPQMVYYLLQSNVVERNAGEISSFNETLVMPGELIRFHQLPETKNCYVCHDLAGKVSDAKCLSCHEKIQNYISEKKGVHGKVEGNCISCHSDHHGADFVAIPLKKEEFNHNQALFSLVGAHRKLECEKCHENDQKRLQFIDLKFSACTDCHDDPHDKQFSQKCETCHSEQDWHGKDLKFEHNKDSRFLLKGKHEKVTCKDCHKKDENNCVRYKNVDHQKCSDCHGNPHQQDLGNCTNCHNENEWKQPFLSFQHDKTSFPLKGKHQNTSCEKCHKKNIHKESQKEYTIYQNIEHQKCNDCHENPHGVTLKNKCTDCHSEDGWKGSFVHFEHKNSKFPLKGKHVEVACKECHKQVLFKGQKIVNYKPKTSCTTCHEDIHKGQFKEKQCTDCHNESGWKGGHLGFEHNKDSQFQLLGKHTQVACKDCHKEQGPKFVQFKNIRFENCTNCHEDVHKGMKQNCTECHNAKGWKGENLSFDHQKTGFPLQFDHKDVSCNNCHKEKNIFKVNNISCDSCHEEYLSMMKGTFLTDSPVPDYHLDIVSCQKCHDDRLHKSTLSPEKLCSSCHSIHYEKLYFDHKILVNNFLRETKNTEKTIFSEKISKIGAHNFLLLKKLIRHE